MWSSSMIKVPSVPRSRRGAPGATSEPAAGLSDMSRTVRVQSLVNVRWRRCRHVHSGLASTKDGLPVYILLCPQLYDRPGNPYGDTAGRDWPDNDVRFGRFASAAAQLAAGTLDKNWAADLVHANDWQAALVPAYLAWNEVRIPTILTIHNLAYQGLFLKDRCDGSAPRTSLPYRRP